jgi:hypothetical protein
MIAGMRTTRGCVALAALLGATPAGCKSERAGGEGPKIEIVPIRPPDAAPGLAPDAGGMVLGRTMPADFPTDIPLYPDAGFTIGGRATAAGKPTWSVTVETGDTKEQVISQYHRMMGSFRMLSDLDLGESALSTWRSDAYDVILVVGRGADGKTTVTINAAARP